MDISLRPTSILKPAKTIKPISPTGVLPYRFPKKINTPPLPTPPSPKGTPSPPPTPPEIDEYLGRVDEQELEWAEEDEYVPRCMEPSERPNAHVRPLALDKYPGRKVQNVWNIRENMT